MEKISLTRSEIKSIKSLLRHIAARYTSAEDPDFLSEVNLYTHDLPRRVRACLNRFRIEEPASAVCIISGYEINQAKIGETPVHWRLQSDAARTIEEEILVVLFSSLLGDVFGWATQQDGHIIHDVFPIREHKNEQIGTGSEQEITWHNEDAFHSCRGDYVALMCLRNPDRVPSTIAAIDMLDLDDEIRGVLFEERFIIRPDYSHSKELNSKGNEGDVSGEVTFEGKDKRSEEHEKVAVLFGDRNSVYIRIDPFFMDTLDDLEAQFALNTLVAMINRILFEIVLAPGDICFIDNYKAVHGRKPFKARFDGTDRWLKRLNVTRDLRKSRSLRASTISRIIS
jgi:Fe(II)/alpha-ketoglutarate-dependent arginine beta-hydroxylase